MGFSTKSQGPLCPHLCIQLCQDPSFADILGQSAQTWPFAGIGSFKLQPSEMLEGQLKKQPNKSHDDNNPAALLKKEAVQKGLCWKPNQFSIKGRRNNKQSLPSSPYPRSVFYLVRAAVLAWRQGSRRYSRAALIKKCNQSN